MQRGADAGLELFEEHEEHGKYQTAESGDVVPLYTFPLEKEVDYHSEYQK